MNRLTYSIQLYWSIKDNFYGMKSINDILFNNQASASADEPGGLNLQKCMGKMLTAVFKDYLIFDDIYEFLEKFYSQKTSLKLIKAYATS